MRLRLFENFSKDEQGIKEIADMLKTMVRGDVTFVPSQLSIIVTLDDKNVLETSMFVVRGDRDGGFVVEDGLDGSVVGEFGNKEDMMKWWEETVAQHKN